LDNDDAGKRAVERLCTSDILLRVVEDTAAEVLVATLPDGIKDPAEFVDEHDGEAFQQKILDTAVPWSDWYMERIVSVCDVGATSGSSDSFPQVCEAVSDFLSSFSNPADRTKRAYEAAGTLSKLLAPNRTDSVGGLRIQLETDLLDMASRKARTREALSRRVEESSGIQRGTNTNIAASLSKGESLSTNQTVSQLSRAALAIATRKNVKIPPSEKSASKKVVSQMKRSAKRKQEPRTEKVSHETKSWKKRSTAPSLTPHFTGFDFVNPTDARWLGIPENEVCIYLHKPIVIHIR
jgi:DNA primase